MLAATDILDGQRLMTWCHGKELTLTLVCKCRWFKKSLYMHGGKHKEKKLKKKLLGETIEKIRGCK
jgi:hypothetical protein